MVWGGTNLHLLSPTNGLPLRRNFQQYTAERFSPEWHDSTEARGKRQPPRLGSSSRFRKNTRRENVTFSRTEGPNVHIDNIGDRHDDLSQHRAATTDDPLS